MQRWNGRSWDRRQLLRAAALGLVLPAGLATARTVQGQEAPVDEPLVEEAVAEAPAMQPVWDPTAPPPVWIPPNLRASEHWVAVNLTEQKAVAMWEDQYVHVALGTTGDDGWETPEGQFTVVRRVYNETMTSAALGIPPGPDSYVLTDVLFTQYFTWEGHALHLNYWRPASIFGRVRTSHGCVGLRYDDAAFFWDWVGIGNRVVIHS